MTDNITTYPGVDGYSIDKMVSALSSTHCKHGPLTTAEGKPIWCWPCHDERMGRHSDSAIGDSEVNSERGNGK